MDSQAPELAVFNGGVQIRFVDFQWIEFPSPILELHFHLFVDVPKGDMNGVDPFLIEAVFDDVSQDLLNGNQEVISQASPDFVLGGEALKDGIHA